MMGLSGKRSAGVRLGLPAAPAPLGPRARYRRQRENPQPDVRGMFTLAGSAVEPSRQAEPDNTGAWARRL